MPPEEDEATAPWWVLASRAQHPRRTRYPSCVQGTTSTMGNKSLWGHESEWRDHKNWATVKGFKTHDQDSVPGQMPEEGEASGSAYP